MFNLKRQSAKLTSLNPRAEIHGEDRVPAADLKFEITAGNDALSEFHPSLRSFLFERPAKPDLADDGQSLTDLRFKLLGPLKLGAELAGYDLRVHWGVSGHDDIAMSECEVDNFRFDCQEGGSVAISFRVIAHPAERDMGRLCSLIQREVEISLTEPGADEDLLDTKGSTGLQAAAEAGAEARAAQGAIKYRNPETGDTWSGRGKRPKWIEVEMLKGSNLEEFLVANQTTEA